MSIIISSDYKTAKQTYTGTMAYTTRKIPSHHHNYHTDLKLKNNDF